MLFLKDLLTKCFQILLISFPSIKGILLEIYKYNFTFLQYHEEIAGMEKEMRVLLESAGLFEVNVPDFKQLKQCRKEIKMLKTLWDYVIMVRSSIDDWKTTPWKEINVEQMDMDCKKFAKDIRSLDKEMRAWDTYSGVENVVKNMLTSLRAVSELQNPAIRERHWQQLMQATKVCTHNILVFLKFVSSLTIMNKEEKLYKFYQLYNFLGGSLRDTMWLISFI